MPPLEISINYLRQVGEEKKQRKGEAKNKAVGPGASNRGHAMAPFAPCPPPQHGGSKTAQLNCQTDPVIKGERGEPQDFLQFFKCWEVQPACAACSDSEFCEAEGMREETVRWEARPRELCPAMAGQARGCTSCLPSLFVNLSP